MGRRKTVTQRPRYFDGVDWIACNDEPTDFEPDSIKGYTSTLLLADLFGANPYSVAVDIACRRAALRKAEGE
jgi:hypothetical protein